MMMSHSKVTLLILISFNVMSVSFDSLLPMRMMMSRLREKRESSESMSPQCLLVSVAVEEEDGACTWVTHTETPLSLLFVVQKTRGLVLLDAGKAVLSRLACVSFFGFDVKTLLIKKEKEESVTSLVWCLPAPQHRLSSNDSSTTKTIRFMLSTWLWTTT